MKIVINPIRPALCDATQEFHLLVRLQSEPEVGFKRTPLNLALVIDRSGSMQGPKLTEAKRCVVDLVSRMSPSDQVGIVQYDDAVDTVMPLNAVDSTGGVLKDLVQRISAGGSTNLHAGWLRAGEMLAPHSGRDAACHVILLSDGLANVGLTIPDRICEQVAALAGAGVTTTTVGLGADFNEELMTAIARAGQGNAHYGERSVDLAETFESEIGLLSQLQWRSVEMRVIAGPEVLEVLNSYEKTEEGWRVPSIAMGSECWALLRIPMVDALRAQLEHGTVLSVEAHATDPRGQRQVFKGSLPPLPEVEAGEFEGLLVHELVQRRVTELEAARLQLQIREAALGGDWLLVEQLLAKLEALGRSEPWVAASIAFTRQLMRERDEQRMSKEMLYKSRKMQSRLSSTEEVFFDAMQEAETPAFLRRKTTEGRRTER
ncbi:MAG: vWA domain-containing protein [Betaproteobacteria bacterium]